MSACSVEAIRSVLLLDIGSSGVCVETIRSWF